MDNITNDIKKIVALLEQLLEQETFPAYKTLKNKYANALLLSQKNTHPSIIADELKFTTRMLMEAPPKNKSLGLEILQLMDKIIKKINLLH